jgi:cytochrome c2
MGEIDRLVITIMAMDPRGRDQQRKLVASAAEDRAYPLPQQPGEGMFRKLCAPCHTIGQGVRVGPDLNGVTERRDAAWLTRFMRDPVGMVARQDPTALALAAAFPAVRMPRFGLTETDAADMISYLRLRSSRPHTAAATMRDAAAPN